MLSALIKIESNEQFIQIQLDAKEKGFQWCTYQDIPVGFDQLKLSSPKDVPKYLVLRRYKNIRELFILSVGEKILFKRGRNYFMPFIFDKIKI